MKKISAIIIIGILILSTLAIALVSAQEINPPDFITSPAQFNFISWFTHTFGIEKFSVVGDSRRCSSSPDYSISILNGVHYTDSASSHCSSGYGIWDIFSPGWNPYKEYNNNVDVTFGSTGGNAQLYCCSHPECSSDSDCQNWVGQYSTCKSASCVSWLGGYKCTTDFGVESNIPYCRSSFKYCSQNIYKDCYYISSGSCVKHTYPGVTTCPSSYQGSTLYSSLSSCSSNICTPTTCAQLGKQCGSASDGCGGTLNCGTCDAGYQCNSVGYCTGLNTTEVPCNLASIQNINITCAENTLTSCNSACPTGYNAGTLDSCGFHSCTKIVSNQTVITNETIPSNEIQKEEKNQSFDINATAFNLNGFNVSYLMLIGIFLAALLLIKISGGRK